MKLSYLGYLGILGLIGPISVFVQAVNGTHSYLGLMGFTGLFAFFTFFFIGPDHKKWADQSKKRHNLIIATLIALGLIFLIGFILLIIILI
jgi:hypothetical protein